MFMERKILRLGQLREGPNKVLVKGLFQFIMDLLKLLIKFWVELIYMASLNLYLFIPIVLFINMALIWVLYPFIFIFLNIKLSIIYLIVLITLKMFYFILIIYLVYSVYRLIRVIRMVVQIISYDIIIILILIRFVIIYSNLNLYSFFMYKFNLKFIIRLIFFIFWLISVIVELIRLPFDFYEGESELISGFNTEFRSFLFIVLVLIEYIEMIYFLILTLIIFMFNSTEGVSFYLVLILIVFFLIWVRVFFVRYRLDKMMMLLWKFIFPLGLMNFIVYYFINLL